MDFGEKRKRYMAMVTYQRDIRGVNGAFGMKELTFILVNSLKLVKLNAFLFALLFTPAIK